MNGKNYGLTGFIVDAIRLMDETDDEKTLLDLLSPLAKRAALDRAWRSRKQYNADSELGYGSTLLHAESDNSLFIVVDSWLPGRGVFPHNHGTWAIVVGVDGTEKNTFWERSKSPSHPGQVKLDKIGDRLIAETEVVSMPSGTIHSVENESSQTTLSFHVYGRHLNHTGRSLFDPVLHLEKPFMIETQ